jgi:23S rRNA maturation-related 3'-5' exoribonuclease YhaM
MEATYGDDIASRIVDGIFGNNIFLKKFLVAPGSNRPHYGRVGGLLANTARVAKQCMNSADAYDLVDMEKIVLMSSSLLFRIGAIDAYEFQDCVPVATSRGTLLGIENLTMTRISSALKRVVSEASETRKVTNQEMIMRIFHAVSAYSCSSILPMTKEAILLASMYRMDSEMVEAIDFIENDQNVSEPFTAYDSALRRKYYRGCKTSE